MRARSNASLPLNEDEHAELRNEAERYGVRPGVLARILVLGSIRRGQTEALLRQYEVLMKRQIIKKGE